jgi:hypothetical protein
LRGGAAVVVELVALTGPAVTAGGVAGVAEVSGALSGGESLGFFFSSRVK